MGFRGLGVRGFRGVRGLGGLGGLGGFRGLGFRASNPSNALSLKLQPDDSEVLGFRV